MSGEANGQTTAVDSTQGAQAAQALQPEGAQAPQVTDAPKATAEADDAAKAREDYEAALAEHDAKIAELEGQIADAAKTAEAAEKLREEMDALRAEGDAQRIAYELALAGARNVKAARALLADHDNDIDKLKAAEPWLFSEAQPKQAGATGLPNAGAASDEGKTMKHWREIAGLDEQKG